MKSILVPTDFSELADKAIDIAIDFAKNTQTTIHLLHSVEILHVWSEVSNYMDIDTSNQEGYSYMHIVTEKATEKLNQYKSLIEKEGIDCVVAVENGKPYESVLHYIKYNNINLAIMGTKGVSGISEAVIGSNAQKIIRGATCPILTIKKEQESLFFDNILLASDFHDDKINANIDYVKRLASYFNSNITLLFVATPLNFLSESELKGNIDKIAAKSNLENYNIVIHKAASAEEGIMEYCQLKTPDIVAISTHGKGFFRKLFISNTTEYLANHLSTPLLSMPMNFSEK